MYSSMPRGDLSGTTTFVDTRNSLVGLITFGKVRPETYISFWIFHYLSRRYLSSRPEIVGIQLCLPSFFCNVLGVDSGICISVSAPCYGIYLGHG